MAQTFTELLNQLTGFAENLSLVETDNESIRLTPETDTALEELLQLESAIEQTKKALQARFLEVATKNPKLKAYTGEHVRVGYTVKRTKTIDGNPEDQFVKIETKPNTQSIEAFREATGRLPDGISESVYEYISFRLVKTNEASETE